MPKLPAPRVEQHDGSRLYVVVWPSTGAVIDSTHLGSGPATWHWLTVCTICGERNQVGPNHQGIARLDNEVAMLNHADAHRRLDVAGGPPKPPSGYGWTRPS